MALCFQNCPSDWEKILKFEPDRIWLVKAQNNFLKQDAFSHIKYIWGKWLGFKNLQEKLENRIYFVPVLKLHNWIDFSLRHLHRLMNLLPQQQH